MPTYDYSCEACGHAFELFQSMTEKKRKTCPDCGKPRLVRLVGAGVGVIFRGSGFYETDYKRNRASEAKAEKAQDGGGSAEGKGEKKPEAKPAAKPTKKKTESD